MLMMNIRKFQIWVPIIGIHISQRRYLYFIGRRFQFYFIEEEKKIYKNGKLIVKTRKKNALFIAAINAIPKVEHKILLLQAKVYFHHLNESREQKQQQQIIKSLTFKLLKLVGNKRKSRLRVELCNSFYKWNLLIPVHNSRLRKQTMRTFAHASDNLSSNFHFSLLFSLFLLFVFVFHCIFCHW